MADESYRSFDVDYVCERLCTELWHAEQIKVAIKAPGISCTKLLRSLQVPLSEDVSPETQWETLGAVLEEWQRPFILVVSIAYWRPPNRENYHLPRCTNGHVIAM